MKKLIPFLLVSFFLNYSENFVFAQRIEQDLDMAKVLKKDYEDESVVAISSESEFEFDLNVSAKSVAPVSVIEYKFEKFIALKDYADFVNSVFYDDMSEVSRLCVLGRNNRKIDVSALDKEYDNYGFFHSDGRIKIFDLDFSSKGEIKKNQYIKEYKDVKYFTSVYFHEHYPVKERIIKFNIPDWFNVEFLEMNFEGFDISKEEVTNEKRDGRIVTYIIRDLAVPESDKNSFGPSHYLPHILILSKSYKTGSKSVNLFSTTDDIYKWYHSLVLKSVSNLKTIEAKVNELTNSLESDEEKIKAIYYWIQDNIRYIAFEDGLAGFMPEPADNVFENKYGDCKGMANLSKEMYIIAGFDARLSWLGTRHIAYDYSIPSIAVDNHMICTLILDGKKIFLDPTEKYGAFGEIAERIQGQSIMIENGNDYILDKIPVFTAYDNRRILTFDLALKTDSNLEGSANLSYFGEARTGILYNYHSLQSDNKEEALVNFLSNNNKNIKVNNIETSDLENREIPLNIDYDIIIENQANKFGTDIYISVDSEREFNKSDIDTTRMGDCLFGEKLFFHQIVNLDIPATYKITHAPDNYHFDSEYFTFKVEFDINDKGLVYDKQIEIKKGFLPKDEFKQWNECITNLKLIYNDQLIISQE